MKKIQDLIKFPSLHRISAAELDKIKEYFYPDFKRKIPIVNGSTLIGIEVEVENVRGEVGHYMLWEAKDDGSLRNNGVEYVTPPIPASTAEMALNILFNALPEDVDFSKRTSIHIHMNVRNMCMDELRSMIMLYLIFEPALFNFVGQDRNKNIHCVPIRQTNFLQYLSYLTEEPHQFRRGFNHISWQKYTALNLVPTLHGVSGTIEFRQLHGTRDINKIMIWLNLILSLKTYVQKHSSKEIQEQIYSLNTNSQYRQFTSEVFDIHSEHLITETIYGEFERDMEEGITQIKTYLSSQSFYNTLLLQLSNIETDKSIAKKKKVTTIPMYEVNDDTLWRQEFETVPLIGDTDNEF